MLSVINHIEIRDGDGYIRGRNLKAKMVARMHLWEGASIEAVMEHYNLNAAEVHAAVAFYYDNRAALDAEYDTNVELLKQRGTSTEDFRAKMEAKKREKRA